MPFGRVSITPTVRDQQKEAGSDSKASGGDNKAAVVAPMKHTSTVHIIWKPPPPKTATLRLEPNELAFPQVLVGGANPAALPL